MRGNERLLDHRSVASFVLGSVLRIGVFGIVPVEFGIHGPWWTIGNYFIGFFTPLSLYALEHGARGSNGLSTLHEEIGAHSLWTLPVIGTVHADTVLTTWLAMAASRCCFSDGSA